MTKLQKTSAKLGMTKPMSGSQITLKDEFKNLDELHGQRLAYPKRFVIIAPAGCGKTTFLNHAGPKGWDVGDVDYVRVLLRIKYYLAKEKIQITASELAADLVGRYNTWEKVSPMYEFFKEDKGGRSLTRNMATDLTLKFELSTIELDNLVIRLNQVKSELLKGDICFIHLVPDYLNYRKMLLARDGGADRTKLLTQSDFILKFQEQVDFVDQNLIRGAGPISRRASQSVMMHDYSKASLDAILSVMNKQRNSNGNG